MYYAHVTYMNVDYILCLLCVNNLLDKYYINIFFYKARRIGRVAQCTRLYLVLVMTFSNDF